MLTHRHINRMIDNNVWIVCVCVYVPEICMNFVIDGTIDRIGGGSGSGGGDDGDYNKQMSEQNTNKWHDWTYMNGREIQWKSNNMKSSRWIGQIHAHAPMYACTECTYTPISIISMINHVDHIYNSYLHEAHGLPYEQITENNEQTYRTNGEKIILWHIVKHADTHARTHTDAPKWSIQCTIEIRIVHTFWLSVGARGENQAFKATLITQKMLKQIIYLCGAVLLSLFHSWWLFFLLILLLLLFFLLFCLYPTLFISWCVFCVSPVLCLFDISI